MEVTERGGVGVRDGGKLERGRKKKKKERGERKMGFILWGTDRQQILIKTVSIVVTLWLRRMSCTADSQPSFQYPFIKAITHVPYVHNWF